MLVNKIYIGFHLDSSHFTTIKNALEITKKKGANILQIFLGNKRLTTLREKIKLDNNEIKEIKLFLKNNDIKLVIHSIYSINFCKDPNHPRNKWGTDNLIYDMNLCEKIGGIGVVLHLGSYKTDKINISYEESIKNFIKSLIIVIDNTKKIPIILETPVNRKYMIGGTIEKLAELYNNIPINYKKRVKICIDTQHIFVSGYDIDKIEGIKNYLKIFNKLIDKKNIKLIHLNDSEREFNTKINRHESIGKGYIFYNNKSLNYLINYAKKNRIPLLLETKYEKYNYEIKMLKGGKTKKNIKLKILKIFKKILEFHESLGKKGNTVTKFRIDSYRKAIKSLENFKGPIYNSNDVKNLDHIGKGFCKKINNISNTGTLNIYENIKKNTKTKSIKIFQKIWGIGPEFAQYLVNNNILSIKDLKIAVKNNKIKLSDQQIIGLKYYNDLKKKIPRDEITVYTNFIKKIFNIKNIEIYNAGSYRIGKKNSSDIDIIITFKKYEIKDVKNKLYNILIENNIIFDTLSSGTEKCIYIIKLPEGKYFRKIDIAFIEKKQLPWYLLYFGSSRDFSKKIRNIASKLGYKLNEKGLYNKNTGLMINFNPNNEKDIFEYLGIKYIDPENRL